MWKKINLLFLLLSWPVFMFSQSLTLEEAVSASKKAYPLQQMNQLNEKITDLHIRSIKSAWLPSVTMNAQATWQSDVTELPISLPGLEIPDLYKDMYKASLDFTQILYDGGMSSARKEVEFADLQIHQEQLKSDLKQIELMTADVYFAILSIKNRNMQMHIMQEELHEQIRILESGIRNGVIKKSYLELLQVELLSLDQKIIELDFLLKANIDVLKQLTQLDITENTEFELPENFVIRENFMLETSEFKLFELNAVKISSGEDMLKVKRMPVIAAFAQVGYGRPGLNMFMPEFDHFYMIGVKASWNLWSGGKTNKEIQEIQIRQDMLNVQKEAYLVNTQILRSRKWEAIETLKKQISTDEEILNLRESILESYASELKNGSITSDEYLGHLNKKTIAAITLDLHKIQLIKEQYNYLRTFGN